MKKYLLALSLLLIISGCQSKKDSDYIKEAETKLKEQKIEEAAKDFEALVADYPQSPLAPKALLELAKIYQAGMIKQYSKAESLELALKYFTQISENHEKSKEAPVALFMVGFIQANELQQFDAARKSYEKFLRLYPDNEYAESVKGELSTLGMTPDQILQQKDIFGK